MWRRKLTPRGFFRYIQIMYNNVNKTAREPLCQPYMSLRGSPTEGAR